MGAPDIEIARAHDLPAKVRVLVDRVWSRGLSSEALGHDDWIRDVAPTSDLQKLSGHDAKPWDESRERYRMALDDREAAERCLAWRRREAVTLLYAAKDREHIQALVLRDFLAERMEDE